MLSLSVFVVGFVVSGIVNVNTTTLERRFDLSSSQVAWISSSYDLCGAILSFVVGYLAIFANKPRMMTISASIMAGGSFIMFLPHLIAKPYSLGNKVMDTCQAQGMCKERVIGPSSSTPQPPPPTSHHHHHHHHYHYNHHYRHFY